MEVELPEDLIRLILVNIPEVKPLARLKLVSKSWTEVISSPRFAAEHHIKHYCYYSAGVVGGNNYNNNSLLSSFLVARTCPNPEVVDFFTLISFDKTAHTMNHVVSEKKNIYMPYLDCRNEVTYPTTLVYDAGFGVYCIFEFETNRVALWNPSLRELKVLPPSPFYSVIKTTSPEYLQHVYGFGHVEYQNDNDGSFNYKVARLISRSAPPFKFLSIELYSSATNAWKLLSDCSRFERYGTSSSRNSVWHVEGTNLYGRFHWLAWFSSKDPHIMWFDFNTEEFGRIEVPGVVVEGRDGRYNLARSHITIFDGRFLCLILYWTSRKGRNYLEVWVLREYGMSNSWTKEGSTLGPIHVDMRIKRYSSNNQSVFLEDIDYGNRLYLCDCLSSSIENLGIGSDEWEEMMVLIYTESLVSLNGNSDETRIES